MSIVVNTVNRIKQT